MNVASSSAQHIGVGGGERSASTWGQSISWAVVIASNSFARVTLVGLSKNHAMTFGTIRLRHAGVHHQVRLVHHLGGRNLGMASVDLTADVPLSPQEAWIHVSDRQAWRLALVHEAWRGDVPDELTVGTTVEGIARVKGMRNRVKWTVITSDPPRQLALSGVGKGGTKFELQFTVRPKAEEGSVLGVRLDLSGRPFFGPLGSGVARAVKGDVQQSLRRFAELYG